MEKCKQCGVELATYNKLRCHYRVAHHMNSIEFHVSHNLNGVWPKCKCGCEENVKWSYQTKAFRDFNQGHQSRVHNNWGHNKLAAERSAETRRQQYASGEREQWNTGQTKETNESVKLNGKLRSKAYTDVIRTEYSERMRKNRLNGTVQTLHGPNHSQWKGGVSEVNVLARSRSRLYKEWKYPILIRDGFKCGECGETKNLQVHHDKERMCEIIEKHFVDDMAPRTFEEKEFIADAVVDYHIQNKVSGITLCRGCHGKIHPSLNFK